MPQRIRLWWCAMFGHSVDRVFDYAYVTWCRRCGTWVDIG